jgi:hypothetical protein
LIELGETNYKHSVTSEGAQSNWPIEVRIMFVALINAVTFIIIKMLANFIGETGAASLVDTIMAYLSGPPSTTPAPTIPQPTPTQNTPIPGGQPVPTNQSPIPGLDPMSLISTFGPMLMRGFQSGTTPAPNPPSTHAHAPTPTPTPTSAVASTPRFRQAYEE